MSFTIFSFAERSSSVKVFTCSPLLTLNLQKLQAVVPKHILTCYRNYSSVCVCIRPDELVGWQTKQLLLLAQYVNGSGAVMKKSIFSLKSFLWGQVNGVCIACDMWTHLSPLTCCFHILSIVGQKCRIFVFSLPRLADISQKDAFSMNTLDCHQPMLAHVPTVGLVWNVEACSRFFLSALFRYISHKDQKYIFTEILPTWKFVLWF